MLSSQNLYAELKKLVPELIKAGEIEIAKEISDSLDYSATSTEILMRCRFVLEDVVQKKTLSSDLKQKIRRLLLDIQSKLK